MLKVLCICYPYKLFSLACKAAYLTFVQTLLSDVRTQDHIIFASNSQINMSFVFSVNFYTALFLFHCWKQSTESINELSIVFNRPWDRSYVLYLLLFCVHISFLIKKKFRKYTNSMSSTINNILHLDFIPVNQSA